jgi:hypothetical protein
MSGSVAVLYMYMISDSETGRGDGEPKSGCEATGEVAGNMSRSNSIEARGEGGNLQLDGET